MAPPPEGWTANWTYLFRMIKLLSSPSFPTSSRNCYCAATTTVGPHCSSCPPPPPRTGGGDFDDNTIWDHLPRPQYQGGVWSISLPCLVVGSDVSLCLLRVSSMSSCSYHTPCPSLCQTSFWPGPTGPIPWPRFWARMTRLGSCPPPPTSWTTLERVGGVRRATNPSYFHP